MNRNPDSTEERLALQCPEAQEAGASQTDWACRCGDLGARRGARAVGDQGLCRKVRNTEQVIIFIITKFLKSSDLSFPLMLQGGEGQGTRFGSLQDGRYSEDGGGREGAFGESAETGQTGCTAGASIVLAFILDLVLSLISAEQQYAGRSLIFMFLKFVFQHFWFRNVWSFRDRVLLPPLPQQPSPPPQPVLPALPALPARQCPRARGQVRSHLEPR